MSLVGFDGKMREEGGARVMKRKMVVVSRE